VSASVPVAPEIGIVDYGMGNRRSVEKALERVGARPLLSADHDRLRAVGGLVLPGVGAFPHAMERLRALGLPELLRERLQAGVPLLGICLGMQLAFERSSELGGAEGLGILPGEVLPLRAGGLKLPHIGWTEVRVQRAHEPLLEGLAPASAFYHVHSFAPVAADEGDVIATARYGEPFVTAVRRGSFMGVQFHPEKSSAAGLRLLENFTRICAAAPAGAGL
jgi:glutamine amidotransferase